TARSRAVSVLSDMSEYIFPSLQCPFYRLLYQTSVRSVANRRHQNVTRLPGRSNRQGAPQSMWPSSAVALSLLFARARLRLVRAQDLLQLRERGEVARLAALDVCDLAAPLVAACLIPQPHKECTPDDLRCFAQGRLHSRLHG